MPREPLSNIGAVCEEHAPKHRPELVKDPKSLIGKCVKKGFLTRLPSDMPQIEHMWVLVQAWNGKTLLGKLHNQPAYCDHLRYGDAVEVELTEVSAVYDKAYEAELQRLAKSRRR